MTQIAWTHNLLILSKTKSLEEKLFYINLVTENKLTTRQMEREIRPPNFAKLMLVAVNVWV